VTESYLEGIAGQVAGLNLAEWKRERANPKFLADIEKDARAAHRAGFKATPSFLVGRTGGAMKKLEYSSLTEPTSFNEAIQKLIAS
jgi:predicted DsbA family dithiol-disulfide isomerase